MIRASIELLKQVGSHLHRGEIEAARLIVATSDATLWDSSGDAIVGFLGNLYAVRDQLGEVYPQVVTRVLSSLEDRGWSEDDLKDARKLLEP